MPKNENKDGIIIRVAGPVVDVRFQGEIPSVNEALIIDLTDKKIPQLIFFKLFPFYSNVSNNFF